MKTVYREGYLDGGWYGGRTGPEEGDDGEDIDGDALARGPGAPPSCGHRHLIAIAIPTQPIRSHPICRLPLELIAFCSI